MADYSVYQSTINKGVNYTFNFHLGGKTGSNLGNVDFPRDAIIDVEADFAFPESRLTGLELGKIVKVTFNTSSLHNALGDSFIDDLYSGSSVYSTDRNISLPSLQVRTFKYPNRLFITENTGLGNFVIFDGVQKTEIANTKIKPNGDFEVEFICIGSYILQQILMDSVYINLSYASPTFYNSGDYNQTMQASAYSSTTTETHVLYDYLYDSPAPFTAVEMKDEDRRDIVYGSASFKEIMTQIKTTAQVMYDLLTRATVSPNFSVSNTDTDNILHNLVLYAQDLSGTTSTDKTIITAYNARLITAIFDFKKVGGVWTIYKTDDLLSQFEFKNAYDFINNILEANCSKASFTYGNSTCLLNWHYAKKSRFSSVTGDAATSYAFKNASELKSDVDIYFKAGQGTSISIPNIMTNGNQYDNNETEELTISYPRINKFDAPSDEINLQFHNLSNYPSDKRRGRKVKGSYLRAWTTLPNFNAMYSNKTLSTAYGTYYVLLRLHEFCVVSLDNGDTFPSIDNAITIPVQDAGDERVAGAVYRKDMKIYIDRQRTTNGLQYSIGKAYNDLYQENQMFEVEVEDIYLKEFAKTYDLSSMGKIVSGYLSDKLNTNVVITGIKTDFQGKYTVTMVSYV